MSEITSNDSRGFTRRTFIKGAAALAASGALVGCSATTDTLEAGAPDSAEAGKEQIFSGSCRGNCFGACFMNVHVRNGQVVRTTARDLPDTRYNRICSKGLTIPERMYSAERLQYPMRRVGERGAGEFERISWDEAIDEIATKWKGYIEKFGPESMLIASASGNSALKAGIKGVSAAYSRFANILGASSLQSNFDHMVDMTSMTITGFSEFTQGNEPTDFENANTIICWGSNPAVSQTHNMHFILEAKEKGTKYIVIDPVFNMNSAKADQYIPINAATDGALALGILNEVIAQGKEDVEFIRNHTEAPLLVKEDGMLLHMSDLGVAPIEGDIDPTTGQPTTVDPYVVWDEATNAPVELDEAKRPSLGGVSEVEGIPVHTVWENLKETAAEYSLEHTAEITGVPVETIQELAEIYSQDAPVYTYMHYGLDRYSTGKYNFWPIEALCWSCGQVGKPGAGCGRTVLSGIGKLNMAAQVPQNGSMAGRTVNSNRLKEILETGTYGGEPFPLKGIFIAMTNVYSVNADQEYMREWLSKIDFVVVVELNMCDTAKWADILLPAADWFEQDEMNAGAVNSPYLTYSEKAVEPLFESKTDFEIFGLIIKAMGYGDQWPWESDEECLRDYLDSDACRALGITYDEIKEKKAMRLVSGDSLTGNSYVSFEGGQFATSTGRALLYQENPFVSTVDQGEIDLSKERPVRWEPAAEADKNSEVRATYPFHAVTDHMRTRTHTQWWNVEYLKTIETGPVVRMNPKDAERAGIHEGDKVKVFNDRGYVVLEAVMHAGLPEGTVSIPRGFQCSELEDGNIQNLVTNVFNQAMANTAYSDVAVAVEKM